MTYLHWYTFILRSTYRIFCAQELIFVLWHWNKQSVMKEKKKRRKYSIHESTWKKIQVSGTVLTMYLKVSRYFIVTWMWEKPLRAIFSCSLSCSHSLMDFDTYTICNSYTERKVFLHFPREWDFDAPLHIWYHIRAIIIFSITAQAYSSLFRSNFHIFNGTYTQLCL